MDAKFFLGCKKINIRIYEAKKDEFSYCQSKSKCDNDATARMAESILDSVYPDSDCGAKNMAALAQKRCGDDLGRCLDNPPAVTNMTNNTDYVSPGTIRSSTEDCIKRCPEDYDIDFVLCICFPSAKLDEASKPGEGTNAGPKPSDLLSIIYSSFQVNPEGPEPCDTAPTPAACTKSKKLNVVVFHGLSQSADKMKLWEAMISIEGRINKDGQIANFHYISAPHKFVTDEFTPASLKDPLLAEFLKTDSFQWFTDTPPTTSGDLGFGFAESVDSIAEQVKEKVNGNVDVMIGLSQGGLMMATALAQYSNGNILTSAQAAPFENLKLAVFIHSAGFDIAIRAIENGCVKPFCPSSVEPFSPLDPFVVFRAPEKLLEGYQTVHIVSEVDKVVPTATQLSLAGRFAENKIVTHEAGHAETAVFPPGFKCTYPGCVFPDFVLDPLEEHFLEAACEDEEGLSGIIEPDFKSGKKLKKIKSAGVVLERPDKKIEDDKDMHKLAQSMMAGNSMDLEEYDKLVELVKNLKI